MNTNCENHSRSISCNEYEEQKTLKVFPTNMKRDVLATHCEHMHACATFHCVVNKTVKDWDFIA